MSQSDQCIQCSRYFGAHTCEAYPDRIPVEIMTGGHDHRRAFPGDNGLRFQRSDETVQIEDGDE